MFLPTVAKLGTRSAPRSLPCSRLAGTRSPLAAALNGEKEHKVVVFDTNVQESNAVTCRDYSTFTTGNVVVRPLVVFKNANATSSYEKTVSRGYQVSSSFVTETFKSMGHDFHAKFGAST